MKEADFFVQISQNNAEINWKDQLGKHIDNGLYSVTLCMITQISPTVFSKASSQRSVYRIAA